MLSYSQALGRIREHLPRTAEKVFDQGGFLTADEVRLIAPINALRLMLLLVRCGNGRFLCPAQDVEHFVAIVTADGRDYVRDVSIPAGGEA
jgi:hypothetical protein